MAAPRWNGKLHKPVKFGDPPSGRTVEGRRLAALKAAETRRFNRMVRERREMEGEDGGLVARIFAGLLNGVLWLLGDRRPSR